MASRSRRRKSRGWVKWVGIVFLAMIVIGVIGNLLGIKPEETPSRTVSNAVSTEAPVSTPADTALPTEDESTESASGNKDWDIIIREGHPTYYGSVEVSHQIWDDVEKGKVIFADGYDEYDDITILTMDAYRNSDLIRDVQVYLKNFEQPMEMSVEEILPIIATYMPFEIMDQYYEFSKSYMVAPDDGDGSCS